MSTLPKPIEDRIAELRARSRNNRQTASILPMEVESLLCEIIAEIQDLRADALQRQIDGGKG